MSSRKLLRLSFRVGSVVFAAALGYVARVEIGERDTYKWLKWRGTAGASYRLFGANEDRIFTLDRVFGFAPRPGLHGTMVLADRRVPTEHDCAAPVSSADVLCVGCSCSYGWGVRAEDAWPGQLGQLTGSRVVNAAGPGWGLAQVALRVRAEAPRLRPRFVVVQASPWLLERSLRRSWAFAVPVPVPYLVDGGLAPPAFDSASLDADLERWAETPEGFLDYQAFCVSVGARLCLERDIFGLRVALAPRVARSSSAAEEWGYRQIAEAARASGAAPVALLMADPEPAEPLRARLLELGFLVADASDVHGADLEIPVDRHPNERCHRLLAERVAAELSKR